MSHCISKIVLNCEPCLQLSPKFYYLRRRVWRKSEGMRASENSKNRFFRKCHKKKIWLTRFENFSSSKRFFTAPFDGRVSSLEFAISSRRQLLEDFWNEMETRFLPPWNNVGALHKTETIQRGGGEATKVLDTSPVRAMFTRKYWKWRTRSRVELKRVSNEFEYTCKYVCLPRDLPCATFFPNVRSREKQTRIESVWESFSNDRFSPEKDKSWRESRESNSFRKLLIKSIWQFATDRKILYLMNIFQQSTLWNIHLCLVPIAHNLINKPPPQPVMEKI